MPQHTDNKTLSDLFKLLSIRSKEQKQKGLKETKQLKKRIQQSKGLEAVSERLRKPRKKNAYLMFLKKHKGKKIKEIRELWRKHKSS